MTQSRSRGKASRFTEASQETGIDLASSSSGSYGLYTHHPPRLPPKPDFVALLFHITTPRISYWSKSLGLLIGFCVGTWCRRAWQSISIWHPGNENGLVWCWASLITKRHRTSKWIYIIPQHFVERLVLSHEKAAYLFRQLAKTWHQDTGCGLSWNGASFKQIYLM